MPKTTKTTPIKKEKQQRPDPPVKQVDVSWHARFIEILSQSCNVTLACRGAGIDRTTAYAHKKGMPDFAQAWEEAIEQAVDILEAEAWQRARKKSDILMIFLLKAHKPEKYREKVSLHHSGRIDVKQLSDEEIQQIIDSEG